jgi:hypothetical protein
MRRNSLPLTVMAGTDEIPPRRGLYGARAAFDLGQAARRGKA